MATAREVIKGALVLLKIRPAESPVTDAEASDGLRDLNNMLNWWSIDGIDIDWETVEDLDETLYVDDGVIGPIESNLAIYIAPQYSAPVEPWLAVRAEAEKRSVRARVLPDPSEFPDTLPVGSGNEWTNYVADGDSPNNLISTRFYPKNIDRKCS